MQDDLKEAVLTVILTKQQAASAPGLPHAYCPWSIARRITVRSLAAMQLLEQQVQGWSSKKPVASLPTAAFALCGRTGRRLGYLAARTVGHLHVRDVIDVMGSCLKAQRIYDRRHVT
jgi:hypothetical protein